MKPFILKLIVKFFNLPGLNKLDGYKGYIGVAILFLVRALEFTLEASAAVPAFGAYALILKGILEAIKPYLDAIGYSAIGASMLSDKAKEALVKLEKK